MSEQGWALFVQAHWTYEERELLKQLILTLTSRGLTR